MSLPLNTNLLINMCLLHITWMGSMHVCFLIACLPSKTLFCWSSSDLSLQFLNVLNKLLPTRLQPYTEDIWNPKQIQTLHQHLKLFPWPLGWEKETYLQLIPTLETELVVFNKAIQGDVVPMYLEEQVPVNKPPSVGKPNQLHNLWELYKDKGPKS